MEENETAEGQEEDLEFMALAKQISSTLDPDQTEKLKQIEVINIFGKHEMFGNEELIPVGSCVDGSKINLPNDSGDIDVLIVPNKIILKESLFDYDKRYPAFLHIRINEEHEKYFRTVKNPVSGIYLPATVLKQVHESFFFICRLIVMLETREGISKDGRFLNVTRTSAVGKELITLNAETLKALGVMNIPYSPGISILGQFASRAVKGIMKMAYNVDGEENDLECRNVNSNSQSLVDTLNELIDMSETEQDDGKAAEGNSNAISQERQSVCLDDNMSVSAVDPVTETVGMGVRDGSSSVTNDGYFSTSTQKKGNSSLENDFSKDGLVPTDLIPGEAKTIEISKETNINNDNPSQDDNVVPMSKRRLSQERQSVCLDDNMSVSAVDPVTETVGMGVRDGSSSVTNDGYFSTSTQKKGNSSLENDFSKDGLVPTDLISGEAKTIEISKETNINNDNPSQDDNVVPMSKRRLSEENPDSNNTVSPETTEIATELENTNIKHPFSRLKSTDFVPAYKFEGWPRPAEEWLERPRKWPAKTVVRQVLECGCHVVAKRPLSMYQDLDSSSTDETDAYFRLSFSESEIILAQNMTERQMLCWRVLKAYQKSFFTSEKKLLTSYHWKNVVFWVSEDVGNLFWEKETVLNGVLKCLDFMIDCLKKKHLPFYFVRQMNLFDGCDENLLESMKTRVVNIRKEPLDYLKEFIRNPQSPETFMLNINRVKNILSKENKSKHTDTVFEGLSSGFLGQFSAWCDSNECDDKGFEKHREMFTKLIKKIRTDAETNSPDAMTVMSDNENSLKDTILTKFEMISDSIMRKENGRGVFKSVNEFFNFLAYNVNASGGCQEHSDEKKKQAAFDFCSHLASSLLELSKEDGVDISTVFAGIQKGSKALIEAKQSEHDNNKEHGEWNRVKPILVGAFPKFIEAIQKSVGRGSTDLSFPAEFRKIINSTSQEIEAVFENENKRNKSEMDIDLD